MNESLEHEWQMLLAKHREAKNALDTSSRALRKSAQERVFEINRRIRLFCDQEQQRLRGTSHG